MIGRWRGDPCHEAAIGTAAGPPGKRNAEVFTTSAATRVVGIAGTEFGCAGAVRERVTEEGWERLNPISDPPAARLASMMPMNIIFFVYFVQPKDILSVTVCHIGVFHDFAGRASFSSPHKFHSGWRKVLKNVDVHRWISELLSA